MKSFKRYLLESLSGEVVTLNNSEVKMLNFQQFLTKNLQEGTQRRAERVDKIFRKKLRYTFEPESDFSNYYETSLQRDLKKRNEIIAGIKTPPLPITHDVGILKREDIRTMNLGKKSGVSIRPIDGDIRGQIMSAGKAFRTINTPTPEQIAKSRQLRAKTGQKVDPRTL